MYPRKLRFLFFIPLILLGSSINAQTLYDYRDKAVNDSYKCKDGDTSSECQSESVSENRNYSWNPYEDNKEIESPDLKSSYSGEAGWSQYTKGENESYKNDSEYTSECDPRYDSNCEAPKINQSYSNDTSYSAECDPEYDSNCDAPKINQNYSNDINYSAECDPEYDSNCDAPKLNQNYNKDTNYSSECDPTYDSNCEAPTLNRNYDNDSKYEGECNEEEEDCEKGSNKNYKLDMSGSNGDYSGYQGDGNYYDGIPGDGSNNNFNFERSKRESWYDGGAYSEDYNGTRDDGKFSGYGGYTPDSKTQKTKDQEFKEAVEQSYDTDGLYKEEEDPDWLMTLIFCEMQAAFEGHPRVYQDKTCRKSIRKLCEFDPEDHAVKGPAACDPFAPWNM